MTGRAFAGRLNLGGEGQGDLAGHGGEQRAMMVYRLESYATVRNTLGARISCPGFSARTSQWTASPTPRSASAEMAALVAAHRWPGLYFRVIQDGELGAGDRIENLSEGAERMTVAEIDALLYSADHLTPRSPHSGARWQGSMRNLAAAAEAVSTTGNAGLELGAFGAPRMAWLPPPAEIAALTVGDLHQNWSIDVRPDA